MAEPVCDPLEEIRKLIEAAATKSALTKPAPKRRTYRDFIALACLLPFFAIVIYAAYLWQTADYDAYFACNQKTGIGKVEWFLGFRPAGIVCGRLW